MRRLAILFLLLTFADVAKAEPVTRIVRLLSGAQQNFTVDTAVFASGDLIGNSKITVTGALLRKGTAELRGVAVYDKDAQGLDLDLVIFRSNPSSTTFTENAALSIADADINKVVAVVPITTHKSFSGSGVSQAKNISYIIESSESDGTLYMALVARGAIDYSSDSAITVSLELFVD